MTSFARPGPGLGRQIGQFLAVTGSHRLHRFARTGPEGRQIGQFLAVTGTHQLAQIRAGMTTA